MKEKTIEQYLINRVKKAGGTLRKIKWVNHRGAPDRLVGFPRKSCVLRKDCPAHPLVELKKPKKKVTAAQNREHKKLTAMGFQVWVISTKEGVDTFIEYYTGL